MSDQAPAEIITEKSLIGSKSVWYPLCSWVVSAVVLRYGIGIDEATSAEVSSLLAYFIVIAVRAVTHLPIGSLLPKT